MRIAVCLPSFNEAKNIGNITRIVDQGLTDMAFIYPISQLGIKLVCCWHESLY